MYELISSPVDYGGLILKNRIIFAPTTLGLSEEEQAAKLEAIAAGGCAMIILGDVPVGRHGFGPDLFSKKGSAHYKRLIDAVHSHGCMICAQLHQSDSDLMAILKCVPGVLTKRLSPDDLRERLNQAVGPYITKLPTAKIARITASFGEAAVRARALGFDMVQVHGDRMCGSFSSSVFNHRTDGYGGGPTHRARFAVEAVSAIRRRLPDMPIDYKLAVRMEGPHYGNAGVLVSELPVFLPLLERAGVTSFHVALADHSALTDTIPPARHPYFSAQGCFLPFCDAVRAVTDLPVCAVGGLNDPDFIEEQLHAGRMDCAAMSRQLIADPEWPDKVMGGQASAVRRCVRCNKACLGGLMAHQGVHCIYERKN